jgi:hypothetical protein
MQCSTEYVDTAVNAIVRTRIATPGPVIGLVVASECVFHSALAFPDPVEAEYVSGTYAALYAMRLG